MGKTQPPVSLGQGFAITSSCCLMAVLLTRGIWELTQQTNSGRWSLGSSSHTNKWIYTDKSLLWYWRSNSWSRTYLASVLPFRHAPRPFDFSSFLVRSHARAWATIIHLPHSWDCRQSPPHLSNTFKSVPSSSYFECTWIKTFPQETQSGWMHFLKSSTTCCLHKTHFTFYTAWKWRVEKTLC
jgi:hypothetical protein